MRSPSSAPTLLVLAAGMGSRYGGLKQIDPVGPWGEIVLDYSVYDAARAGFKKVVFVIRKELEGAFRERVGRRFASRLEVRNVFQELSHLPAGHLPPAGREKPWRTGHCWRFTPQVFSRLENALADFLARRGAEPKAEFFLPSAVAEMIAQGAVTVRVLPTQSVWCGITYQLDRPRVAAALQQLIAAGDSPVQLRA